MIFVTVGGQMPFDRLVETVDRWHRQAGNPLPVSFQIAGGSYLPASGTWIRYLGVAEFLQHMRQATVIVAHAGMGSILTALEHEKPILVMPRQGVLSETRNNHQVATATALRQSNGINVAMNENELWHQLDQVQELRAGTTVGRWASPELQGAISAFLFGETRVEERAQGLVNGSNG